MSVEDFDNKIKKPIIRYHIINCYFIIIMSIAYLINAIFSSLTLEIDKVGFVSLKKN